MPIIDNDRAALLARLYTKLPQFVAAVRRNGNAGGRVERVIVATKKTRRLGVIPKTAKVIENRAVWEAGFLMCPGLTHLGEVVQIDPMVDQGLFRTIEHLAEVVAPDTLEVYDLREVNDFIDKYLAQQ